MCYMHFVDIPGGLVDNFRFSSTQSSRLSIKVDPARFVPYFCIRERETRKLNHFINYIKFRVMKKVMIMLAACLLASTSLFAQPQGQRGPHGVNLDEIPGITAEQKQKIEAVQAAQREEMQKNMQQNRESRQQQTEEQREAMRQQMEQMQEKMNKEVEAILTPEQYKTYQEKQSEMRQRQGNRGRGPQARMETQRRGNRNAPDGTELNRRNERGERHMAMRRPSSRHREAIRRNSRNAQECPCRVVQEQA